MIDVYDRPPTGLPSLRPSSNFVLTGNRCLTVRLSASKICSKPSIPQSRRGETLTCRSVPTARSEPVRGRLASRCRRNTRSMSFCSRGARSLRYGLLLATIFITILFGAALARLNFLATVVIRLSRWCEHSSDRASGAPSLFVMLHLNHTAALAREPNVGCNLTLPVKR